ncbi:MAG: polysaccharide pyruvyl transferase family protein [Youngiibacter sp.]|nr:polysaccharide pyruvyl transferase family protein [Youngiibacter sp.]
MNQYIIIPSCSDLNRGDQALTWETIRIAKDAGFNGEYSMLRSGSEPVHQSEEEGIKILNSILLHPSRKFKSNENIKYNMALILKWGIVALIDLLASLLILSKVTRNFAKVFLRKDQKQTLKIFEESNAVFVKGGGFLHSAGRITDTYKIYYFLFHIFLAQSMKKPVYIMPNSYGPFNGLGVFWLVRKALDRSNLVTVRESISNEMLKDIKIDAQLFPDLGFALEKSTMRDNKISDLRIKHVGRKLVAITARPYRFSENNDPSKKYKEYINAMVMFSRWLYENNYLPVFVEHTLSENTHENDGAAISEIVSKLNNNEYEILSSYDYNCRDLKFMYSKMDYVVGTRFHSVIFSLAERIPSIAITYGGNKGQGIMRDLGLAEYSIPIDELNSQELINSFISLSTNREQVSTYLKQCSCKIQDNHAQLVEVLKKLNGNKNLSGNHSKNEKSIAFEK